MTSATATEPTTSANQVKIEDAGPARKRIQITIPAEIIDEKLRESLSTLAHQTALPGFRKGHVPQKLLERRFGSSVRTETRNQLVASAYAEAIEQHKLKPVGEPEPGEEMKTLELEAGKALSFSLEVEVLPTFELPSFEDFEIKKPTLEITEKHIKEELRRQQLLHGTGTKIESDFKEGDRLLGYATVVRNDEEEPFFRQDNVLVVMPGTDEGGRGQVLGLMIDGLHGMLKDKKIGDAIAISTVAPEMHEREDIRGAKLAMNFEIRVAERIEPATPAIVAERYGLPSEDILREQIKLGLEHRRDEEQASAMREQVVDQLSDAVKVELPDKLSAQQAARSLEQYRLQLLYQGTSTEEVEERLAERRGDSETMAREGLKRFFLLHRLGEHFNIEVSEQEINGRIAAIAAQRNSRPEKLRAELAQSGRLGEVARLIRDQKAADRVVQQAKKVDVTAEEWNEIFKAKQQKARKASEKPARKPAKKAVEKAADHAPKAKASEAAPAKKKTTKKK